MDQRLSRLGVKIFADGADFDGVLAMYKNPLIKGFTTNPTLMRKAGVSDYEGFARRLLAAVPDRPISFEVFADEPLDMVRQARAIASWGKNVNVKIPVMNTQREFMGRVIEELSGEGIAINVTAVFTPHQVARIAALLAPETPAIVSVFAGQRCRSGAADAGSGADLERAPESGIALGEPARIAQHLPGRHDRLPHHYRHA